MADTTPQQHAETLRIIAIAEHVPELKAALDKGAEALTRSCEKCGKVRENPGGDLMCVDPSEANPMHWQATFEQFGCIYFTAKE